jgi:[acyl-carrier-protein] S-malonyltransferase
VIANVTAAAEIDPEVIRKLLVEQVTGRVRWRESVIEMGRLGVNSLVEVGAGKVLTGLVRRIDRNIKGQSIQTPAHIEVFATSLNS